MSARFIGYLACPFGKCFKVLFRTLQQNISLLERVPSRAKKHQLYSEHLENLECTVWNGMKSLFLDGGFFLGV